MKKRVFVILIVVIMICFGVIGVLFYKLNNNQNNTNKTNSSLKSSKKNENNDETIINNGNNIVDSSNQETSDSTLNSVENTNISKTDDSNNKKEEKTTSSISNGTSSSSKTKYSCPSGTTLDGTICIEKKKAQVTYKCVNGELVGDSCIINTSILANVTYMCSSGELNGDTCYINQRVSSYNESDYAGYSITKRNQFYNIFVNNCLVGYNARIEEENGIKYCIITTTSPASASYNCNGKEGSLAGDTCVSAKVEKAYAEYKCDSGYGLDVPYCIKTTPATKIK